MIEKTLKGKPAYWIWLAFLGMFMAIGAACYVRQYNFGLGMTGMSRDVSWGLYISQFTFLVGVAAGDYPRRVSGHCCYRYVSAVYHGRSRTANESLERSSASFTKFHAVLRCNRIEWIPFS